MSTYEDSAVVMWKQAMRLAETWRLIADRLHEVGSKQEGEARAVSAMALRFAGSHRRVVAEIRDRRKTTRSFRSAVFL